MEQESQELEWEIVNEIELTEEIIMPSKSLTMATDAVQIGAYVLDATMILPIIMNNPLVVPYVCLRIVDYLKEYEDSLYLPSSSTSVALASTKTACFGVFDVAVILPIVVTNPLLVPYVFLRTLFFT